MTEDSAKQAWQASVEIAGNPPLEEVRKGADKFYRRYRLRNMIEYVAGAIGAVVFTVRGFTAPTIYHQLGCAMLVAAMIYMPWQLHRRASAVPRDMAGAVPIYDFLRGELVRQQDNHRRVVWWYLLPFVPGMALIFAGNGLDPEIEAAGIPIWARWLLLAGIFAVGGFVWGMHQVAADKLQKRIDEIDVLTVRTE